MKISRVCTCFYSPTHTTEKIVRNIVAGLGIDQMKVIENNLTYPEHPDSLVDIEPGDLVILGGPVYAGRIAIDALQRIESIKFFNNPVVLVAVYGNRNFDDALIDLRETALKLGLKPIAAAAFIGEHSYSTRDFPIAKGRPDDEDKKLAKDFGMQIAAKIQAHDSIEAMGQLSVPGTFPLPPRHEMGPSHAETVPTKCNECGACQTACPTGAVYYDKGYHTDASRCTICCACIKVCNRRARIVISDHVQKWREMLANTCAERKEPQTFL